MISKNLSSMLRPSSSAPLDTGIGKKLHTQLAKVGQDASDRWGDWVIGLVSDALKSNLPDGVDKSDLEVSKDPEGEIWDNALMEAEMDATSYFFDGLIPYVVAATYALCEGTPDVNANGLDWGFPMSVTEFVRERYPGIPEPPTA